MERDGHMKTLRALSCHLGPEDTRSLGQEWTVRNLCQAGQVTVFAVAFVH